ncbi:LamB/YcsF family protein [Thioclava sp. NG1]|uniref:LamB/YcsF family protein n=1 Tax=Thioclava sp. NG1 TaxID=2182426 RepID=UPI000D61AB98|nr:5-oxoprolinase subunit PxpA [Thioclava sp. NG1]PWE48380.1 LamB/YcsF family protein [Thioclava sp. NG1]
MKIDINSDMGEGFGPYSIADDAALMGQISSANVACGYHAGDPMIMERTVRLAREHGVDLGAHVSFPDRMGFGRRKLEMDLDELEAHILYQIGALDAFARRAGHGITHMNPHGALGNLASSDPAIAEAVARATMDFDPEIAFLVLPGSALERAALERGGKVIRLFLADRGYTPDGQLAPRNQAGALIKNETEVVERVIRVLLERKLTCVTGEEIEMPVQSVLLHSDTPGAVALATRLRQAIANRGGEIVPLTAQ